MKETQESLSSELDAAVPDNPEVVELRSTLRRTQRDLARAKAKTEDYKEVLYQAARDAAISIGKATVPPKPKKDKRKGNAEVALVHTTDWQVGKQTSTYNSEVAEQRLAVELPQKIERLTELQREAHPVREAHYLVGGDMVEGITIFPGQAWAVDSTLFTQLFHAANILERQLLHGLSVFDVVHVWEEKGNHGRIGRKGENPDTDNVDLFMYRIVQERFRNEPRIVWHNLVAPHIWNHVKIGNYSALLFHGDEIKSFGGNCVTPDVRVLTRDLRWVPAGELQVGDDLLAFTEHGDPVRKYCDAKVTATGLHKREVWKLTFADGSYVRCTPEHAWIVSQTDRVSGGTNRQVWMTPPEIAQRLSSGGRKHNGAPVWMFQPVAPWGNGENDYETGLLAGAFDADGCISKGPAHARWPVAEFAQYVNPLWETVKLALESKGFAFKERMKPTNGGKQSHIGNINLASRDETLRFLGQVRPARLLDWWMNRIDVNELTFTRKSTSGLKEIVACEPDGVTTICALTTSSETYITEHGPAHNTPAFGILRKVTKWKSGVAPAFKDAYMGHYHTPMTLVLPDGGRIFGTGSPESDNSYATEFMAETGEPSQRIHFVNPERGSVTAEYTIWFD